MPLLQFRVTSALCGETSVQTPESVSSSSRHHFSNFFVSLLTKLPHFHFSVRLSVRNIVFKSKKIPKGCLYDQCFPTCLKIRPSVFLPSVISNNLTFFKTYFQEIYFWRKSVVLLYSSLSWSPWTLLSGAGLTEWEITARLDWGNPQFHFSPPGAWLKVMST